MRRCLRARLGLAGVVLGGTVAVMAPTVASAFSVHTVGDASAADFTSISAAITAAAAGDVIVVLDQGTYSECLEISKDLTLVGSRAPDGSELGRVTVSCATSGAPALKVTAGSVQVAGLAFTHSSGRGIQVDGSRTSAILADVQVSGTTAADGGGLAVTDGYVALHRVQFDDVSASSDGGAVYVDRGTLLANDVTITKATAANGGGIAVSDGSLTANNLTISGSSATGRGGGLHFSASSALVIAGASFRSNESAEDGGGLYIDSSSTARISDAELHTNTTSKSGGGLYANGPVALTDATFFENTAGSNGGGAVIIGVNALTRVVFRDNETGEAGGGVYVEGSTSSRECLFDSNTANDGGGLFALAPWDDSDSLFDSNVAVQGGGGAFVDSYVAQLYGTVFIRNSATDADGGGLWIDANTVSGSSSGLYGVTFEANDADFGRGGGMYTEPRAKLVATGLEVLDNTAEYGGGLYLGRYPDSLIIDGSRIHGNTADYGGGVASVHTSLDTSSTVMAELRRTRIYDNTADVHGGGIYLERTGIFVLDGWVYENAADKDGGAIYTDNAKWVRIRSSTLCQNTAGSRGGAAAFYSPWGYRELYGVSLIGNTSGAEGGAMYLYGYNATTSNRPDTIFYQNSVLGNDSTGTLFDGVHNDNTGSTVGQINAFSNHYGFQAYSSQSQSDSRVSSSTVRNSTFLGSGVQIMNNPIYRTGDSYGNLSANPGWTKYSRSNCFDDDLRTSSFTSYGAAAVTSSYGRQLFVDGDGDGVTVYGGDCHDSSSAIYPGNTEVVGNFIDEDCVAGDDRDGDDDGYAAAAVGGTDCDDSDSSIYPGASDTPYDGVDSDCSGGDHDADGDGYDEDVDCDDTDASVHPGAIESAFDGIDQDCDGLDLDLDGDGYIGAYTASDGTLLSNPATGEADCDPGDDAVSPDGVEVWYDGVDQDCLGDDDYDQDGDGDRASDKDPLELGGDCDDTDASVSSLAAEIWYDGIDQNCDELSDFDQDFDLDESDRYGGGDCDDTDPTIYDGAPDILDEDAQGQPIDNDCDRKANPDDDGDGVLNWYEEQQGTNPRNNDSDGDTIPDGVEWPGITSHELMLVPIDTDGDGTIDVLDPDSDDDGLADKDEVGTAPRSPRDTDGDGIPDYRDTDDDGDGLSTADEIAGGVMDSDGDGKANHLDVDSDNDGVHDGAEGMGDGDGDGVADYLDAGSDWGMDTAPTEPSSRGFGLGCSATGVAPIGLSILLLPLLMLRRRRR